MLYQRSKQIEDRLDALLGLIQSRRYATPALAVTLHVSIPTVSRGIDALRGRGYPIRAIREKNRWYYAVEQTERVRRKSARREPRDRERTLGQS